MSIKREVARRYAKMLKSTIPRGLEAYAFGIEMGFLSKIATSLEIVRSDRQARGLLANMLSRNRLDRAMLSGFSFDNFAVQTSYLDRQCILLSELLEYSNANLPST